MNLLFVHFSPILAEAVTIAREWEDGGTILFRLLVILALVSLNGFFVAAEFALVKVRASQLDALIEEGRPGAKRARHVFNNLESYLSASQLGITLASLALGWVGEPYLARMLSPFCYKLGLVNETAIHTICLIIAFASITSLHIILGEQAPKILAIRKPVPTTLWVSRALKLFYTVFKPAIWFLNASSNALLRHFFRIEPVSEHELAHSEEELRVILAESARAEEVTSLGKEILINALDMQKRAARDITTPRGEVVFLDTQHSFEENLRLALESRHTRFPLCREHLDNSIGLVHIKDLLKLMREQNANLESIKRDLLTVPEMISLEKLLNTFLSKHAHLALVVDEFGGAVGVVTLDNVLEELVGDIQDEFDSEKPEMRRVNKDEFVVQGSLGLYEVKDLIGIELESEEVTTVGGYITELLGHLPKEGEKTRIEDFEITVSKADGRRVLEVVFKRAKHGERVSAG